ncbi:MAG TPA: SIMPL domain-containing protein [Tepidisphaeraceae bacterium]|jgi:hypothetical protein|nr:SIMPL domain-containing protein [Tepidisphaeraceae bacterium]
MRLFKFAFAAAILLASSIATVAKADAPPSTRTISTSGEAVIYVVPDEVIVNFGVENFDADLDKAKAANDAMSTKLLKAIKTVGVEDKNVQIDRLQITLEYKDNQPWTGLRGYITRRDYSITLKDVKLFEKLVDAALKNGANQVGGFEFCTTEMRKYRDQARSLAIKAAKEKAVALAKDLDCGVGKPWQIGEVSYGYGNGNFSLNSTQNAMQAVGGADGENGSTLPLGQIAVRASVSVVFDLTDK